MTLYLPTSHWVSHDLRKREEQPIAKGGNADVCKTIQLFANVANVDLVEDVGIYQGRLVALKCLRASAVEGSLQKASLMSSISVTVDVNNDVSSRHSARR